ncbi:MAG: tRNA uridine(34) 5-carboxymethylaminomethyl modification radical SAM/GNAT enzyme Elp3 [Promethearchaeota archaeon]
MCNSDVTREIIKTLIEHPSLDSLTKKQLERIKRKISGRYGMSHIMPNSALLAAATPEEKQKLESILRIKPIRTLSGVTVVAVMTKPGPCPGNCLYCPVGPNAPQSYTGREPAAMRGIQNAFDPYEQVNARIRQYREIGHDIDKIHLIIMGGTFLSTSNEYQFSYMKGCLDAITNLPSANFSEAVRNAESSKMRLAGVTIETRPDYCMPKHTDRILELGGTWAEIGIQTLSDEVLKFVKRGHTIADATQAIQVARDAGLKITLHLMPNLFQTPEEDIQMFHQLYKDPHYMPDALKIYPCLVLEGTELYEMWKKGEYAPYPEEEVVRVVAEAKALTPPFVRIQRVQRDIPAYLILDGVKASNLREVAANYLKEHNKQCRCIRCREVGQKVYKEQLEINYDAIKLSNRQYNAADGIENFISFEDPALDIIFGFLRLRIPSENAHRPEILGTTSALVRELHVYGPVVKVGEAPFGEAIQHRGFGKQLLNEAERIAREEFDCKKILVTSGIGVRRYYERFGYSLQGPYESKAL